MVAGAVQRRPIPVGPRTAPRPGTAPAASAWPSRQLAERIHPGKAELPAPSPHTQNPSPRDISFPHRLSAGDSEAGERGPENAVHAGARIRSIASRSRLPTVMGPPNRQGRQRIRRSLAPEATSRLRRILEDSSRPANPGCVRVKARPAQIGGGIRSKRLHSQWRRGGRSARDIAGGDQLRQALFNRLRWRSSSR